MRKNQNKVYMFGISSYYGDLRDKNSIRDSFPSSFVFKIVDNFIRSVIYTIISECIGLKIVYKTKPCNMIGENKCSYPECDSRYTSLYLQKVQFIIIIPKNKTLGSYYFVF